MQKRIGIISNLGSRGLCRDANLLKPIIESQGYEVTLIQYDEPCEETFSLCLFLEVTPRNLIKCSEAPPWVFVNPEFVRPENVKIIQRHFAKVLCKTREAHRICSEVFGEKAEYVGFISAGKFDATVQRTHTFLHIAGNSKAKGTQAVMDAWRWRRNGEGLNASLIIVSDWLEQKDAPNGVTVYNKIDDEELARLQNGCMFHLQPSETEGWSHVIHEAMSVNATILTVDAAPMNEIHSAYKIPSTGQTKLHLATMNEVSALDIYSAVRDMLKFKGQGFASQGLPRQEFLAGNEAFRAAFAEQLKDLETKPNVSTPRVKSGVPCIAFCGNFQAQHSTENELAWSMEFAGYEVVRLQENMVSLRDLEQAFDCDVFWWVRTPGWIQIPDADLFSFLASLKEKRIPSVAYHLDRFFGIPERERLIGEIPFWKCDFCFTADGDNQSGFWSKGVNHIYLPPAVALRGCYPGTPKDELRIDVGFVGSSTGYHSEYPQREQLMEFLQKTYGERFRAFSGYRGQDLNDLYASIRVCIGDSCFANTGTSRHYFSDRVPETLGRFGVLVHPSMEGLNGFDGLVTHKPGDFEDLKRQVDLLLADTEGRLRLHRNIGAAFVRENHTYSNRVETVMSTIGLK